MKSRLFRLIRKALNIYKNGGLDAIADKINRIDAKIDVIEFYNYITDNVEISLNKEDYSNYKDKDITVNWIIPTMDIGSGGHINILRFVSGLQELGYKNRVYIFGATNHSTNDILREFLRNNYGLTSTEIEVYNNVAEIKFAHATIATSWQTAYFVRKFNNTISKFYFVQDFEPYFYSVGSEYIFAENTYKFGFRGITAGDWLKDKLRDEYHMITDSFSFSYDRDLYTPKVKRDDKKRLFFYARPVTPRRAFELGLLALNELYKRVPEIEVVFAGWDVSNYVIPFIHLNAGSVRLEELSDLYAQCDLCLVLSNTNLSLLPLEIMASNSVAVCSKGANSSWLVDETNSILVDYDPIEIAKTLEYYLLNRDKLEEIRENGLKFAHETSWDKEVVKVRDIILKGIEEDVKK